MQELGYCIDARSGHFIATWINSAQVGSKSARRQQIIVLKSVFLRVLPSTDRRVAGGTQFVTIPQLVDLGFLVPPAIKEAAAYEHAVTA